MGLKFEGLKVRQCNANFAMEAKKEKQQQEELDQPDIPMDGQRSKKRKCGESWQKCSIQLW